MHANYITDSVSTSNQRGFYEGDKVKAPDGEWTIRYIDFEYGGNTWVYMLEHSRRAYRLKELEHLSD